MGKLGVMGIYYIFVEILVFVFVMIRSQINVLIVWKVGGSCLFILDFDFLEIVCQFIIKQMFFFCLILLEEFLGFKWIKFVGVGVFNVKVMLVFIIGFFNLVVDIILQYDEVKKWVLVIKYWIKIVS